jgi:pimeloyl-ACP methyl ester carboxylesterase
LLSRLYLSPDSEREPREITDPKAAAGGWIGRLGAAKGLPDWLTEEDLDYVVGEFKHAGFRGGINYYRNFQRNWELTESIGRDTIKIPTLFLAGSEDMVIGHATQERLEGAMARIATDLRGVVLLPGIGHWIQQEAPEATNAALLEFLNGL